MKEIRIHGRGGQGSLVLAQLMAIAALEDRRYGQAFPFLGGGGERRGRPIMAFCRLGDQPIRWRSRVTTPDYVIVQDATIFGEVDVTSGLKEGALLLVNMDPDESRLELGTVAYRVRTFSADRLAREVLGRPLVNAALLGAFAAVTGELSLEAATHAVLSRFSGEIAQKNALLLEESYRRIVSEGA